jgi:hypothetical protein
MIRRGVTVALALIGVLALAPAASAQALFRADGLVAYDSTDKVVGDWPDVMFRTGAGRILFLSVYPSVIVGSSSLYFPQPGCAGQPFLYRSSFARQPHTVVSGPRHTVYIQAGAFSERTMLSTLDRDGTCVSVQFTVDFAPAVLAGIDLADYFTPPFTIRATPGAPIPTGAVAQPLDPGDRFVIFDATGKKVGAPLGGSGSHQVPVVTDSGMTLLLYVSDSAIGADFTAYFESTDCTGSPVIRSSEEMPIFHPFTLVGLRSSVYARSGTATSRTVFSRSTGGSGCAVVRNSRTGALGETANFAPTSPLGIDLADYFTPPFTVRAGTGTRTFPN